MNQITINGVTITATGNITVRNGRVTVNGQDVTPGDAKQITIEVKGDVPELTVDSCHYIAIAGNAGSVRSTSGDIRVENSAQSVQTVSGDVECGDVNGSVQTTSGDVECGAVAGNVHTLSGDIKHKRK